MDNRFTNQARRVLRLAGDEAHRFNCGYVGTEHLLLALLHEKTSPAARVLTRLGVDCLVVWREIDRRAPAAHTQVRVRALPQTPRVKLAIDRAEVEARQVGPEAFVGTRQLLLGLLRDPECVATAILLKLGVRIVETCDDLLVEPDSCEVQERESAFSAPAEECIRRAEEFDHIRGKPACSPSGGELRLDLPNAERSLDHEGQLGRFWRFLLRLLGFDAGSSGRQGNGLR